jgi:hypothetical protein
VVASVQPDTEEARSPLDAPQVRRFSSSRAKPGQHASHEATTARTWHAGHTWGTYPANWVLEMHSRCCLFAACLPTGVGGAPTQQAARHLPRV